MNNWLNRLERKYGRFGIPNLTNILVGGQILVLAIELFVNRTVMAWLALSRFFLLQGNGSGATSATRSTCFPGCWAPCWPAWSPA